MGIWSCIGTTLEEVCDALYQGRSGIVFSPERKEAGFGSALVGNVPKTDLKPLLPRSLRSFMPEEAQYAYMATRQALQQARQRLRVLRHLPTSRRLGRDAQRLRLAWQLLAQEAG